MRDRDTWLNATMIELADTGNDGFDEATYAHVFTRRLAELLRPAGVCLLMPAGNGQPAVTSGSSAATVRLARLESDSGIGPGSSCYRTGRSVRGDQLAAGETRWPAFTSAASAAGLSAQCALPMRHDRESIGAVVVLTAPGRPAAVADMCLAQALVEVATIGILRQRSLLMSRRLARQLQHALDSRVVIEQAKGAVAALLGVTTDEAFEMLRGYARARSRRLLQVAAGVLDGTIPLAALATPAAGNRRNAESGAARP